jgi:hypothetical protein
MIDATTADALSRVAGRARDLLQAYRGGFEPESGDATIAANAAPALDPLSVVAPEGTFFVMRGRDGTPLLSRDGSFAFVDGELRSSDGSVALGTTDASKTLRPLRVDPIDAALGRVTAARIEADGSIGYLRESFDPRSGERRTERVTIGRLTLARLPAGTLPQRVDATHVRAPRGVLPLVGAPSDGTFAPLTLHARDLGRLNVAAGLQRLQEAYLSLEALLSANHARGGVERTTMDLLK